MTQTVSYHSHFRTIPGHVYSPVGAGNEPESIFIPYTLQQLTFTLAGANPIDAGDYEYRFVGPAGPFTVTVTQAAVTPTAGAVVVAAALNADPTAGGLYTWTSNLGVVTGVAKSGLTSIALPTTTTVGATTNTAAISVAAAVNTMRLGLWYVYASTTYVGGAVTNTPHGAWTVTNVTGSTTVAQLRGVVARSPLQTTLGTFTDNTAPDAYRSGQIGFGINRGRICTVVDPVSGLLAPGSALYVVIAAGTNSIIGSVTSTADGANTLRLDNTTPGRARVVDNEETFSFGAYSGRCVVLDVNQTL